MAEFQSKVEKIELINGDTVELTFNFARLLYLRANGYEKEVNDAMNYINNGIKDVLDIPDVLYAAYLCATKEPAYDRDEFVSLIPFNIDEVVVAFNNLISKKKVDISKMRSSAAAGKKAK